MVNAGTMVGAMLGGIIAIVVSAILIAELLPIAVDAVLDANTTGWGDAETELFLLFPLFFVLLPFAIVVAWTIKVF